MALAVGSPRAQVRVASGLDVIAGLWLLVSAFIFRVGDVAAWDLAIIGLIVAVLASVRWLGGYKPSWPSWVNSILGLWVMVSPWTLSRSLDHDLVWNSVITGFIIVTLAIWSALATEADEGLMT
jgi:hypothetical protein